MFPNIQNYNQIVDQHERTKACIKLDRGFLPMPPPSLDRGFLPMPAPRGNRETGGNKREQRRNREEQGNREGTKRNREGMVRNRQ